MKLAGPVILLLCLPMAGPPCLRAQDVGPTGEESGVAAREGSWGRLLELPTHPEQMAVLPSGKVLMWPWAPGRRNPPHGPVALWDPRDGSSTVYHGTGLESGSGLAFQSDGLLLSAGGDQPDGGIDGNARSFVFDYRTETLEEVASMSRGRVFPSATTLTDGRILVSAGLDERREVNAIPELWDGEGWTALAGAGNDESLGPTYQFLAPDGRLFRAGPEPLTDWLEVRDRVWTDVEPTARNQPRYQGSAVLYDLGKVLLTGGCPTHRCEASHPVASAEVIDLRASSPRWKAIEPMTYRRHSHHATLLPDGTVLVTGGTDRPEVFNGRAAGVLPVELWHPSSESFEVGASMSAPRHFQSAAVLLHDGRVLVAGGAFGSNPDDATFASSGQIYSPPYLHRGPRPGIAGAPSAFDYGERFRIRTPEASGIAAVTMVGLSASSQGWNGSQRLLPLPFGVREGHLVVQAPREPTAAPPGFYLMFLLNGDGIPSEGHPIELRR